MLIVRGGLRLRCDMEKLTCVYTEFLNIAKIWPNLAPVLRIWRKKYLSGESGGERKRYPSANPDSWSFHMNRVPDKSG